MSDLTAVDILIDKTLGATDPKTPSYHVPGITYPEHWGPPGQAAAVLGVQPNQAVLDLQAALADAVGPFVGSGGTDAAFVTEGQPISQTTRDWVETYIPDQFGANYTAHLTVGLDTVEHLKAMQAEPFNAFDVRPVSSAVYQLGNNGTARTLLKEWPL